MSSGRLLTIVCADACGFTARAAADEESTLAALHHARDVMREVFAAHDGRILNTWGDGVIAVFETVRGALSASLAFQDAWARTQTGSDPMRFRFGINVDDVIDDGSDIYGHGVNLAARLQQSAQPGGVVVSDAVYATLVGRGPVVFSRVEALTTKPTDPPMAGWRVVTESELESRPDVDDRRVGRSCGPPAGLSITMANVSNSIGTSPWRHLNGLERVVLSLLVLLWGINLVTSPGTIWAIYPTVPLIGICLFIRVLRSVFRSSQG